MISIQKIQGLPHACPESIEGTSHWYACAESTNAFCDLYEAEEIFKQKKFYAGLTWHLLHFPDGSVFKRQTQTLKKKKISWDSLRDATERNNFNKVSFQREF